RFSRDWSSDVCSSDLEAMGSNRYTIWFLGTVILVIAAVMTFNWAAGAYILGHRAGGSVQTLSGFERAVKPVWLAQIKPELVFVEIGRASCRERGGLAG